MKGRCGAEESIVLDCTLPQVLGGLLVGRHEDEWVTVAVLVIVYPQS